MLACASFANVTLGCRLHVAFVDKEGQEHTFEVAKGDNLLDIAQANDLEMEGMALEGGPVTLLHF